MKLDLPTLVEETDRHGNTVLYVRKKVDGRTKRIRLRAVPGTPAFLTEYQAALDAVSGAVLMRACPYLRVDVTHIQMLRDRKVAQGLSGAAINRKKYMGSLFAWAIEEKKFKIKANSCRDVKKPKHVTSGFYTWTANDVAKFVERHPIGTTAYLALCLMLFLGALRQDAIRLGPKNRRDGLMRYVPKKTTYKRVDESVKPILAPLAEAIRRTERTGLCSTGYPITYGASALMVVGFDDRGPVARGLLTYGQSGDPRSEHHGNKMRDWCDQAGLTDCTAHGLKKIAATIVAELGATNRQMMALFDWETERMATVYTDKANKAKMAADAARLLGQFSWGSTPPEGEQNAAG